MPNVPSDKARSFFQNRRRETIGTLYVTLANTYVSVYQGTRIDSFRRSSLRGTLEALSADQLGTAGLFSFFSPEFLQQTRLYRFNTSYLVPETEVLAGDVLRIDEVTYWVQANLRSSSGNATSLLLSTTYPGVLFGNANPGTVLATLHDDQFSPEPIVDPYDHTIPAPSSMTTEAVEAHQKAQEALLAALNRGSVSYARSLVQGAIS